MAANNQLEAILKSVEVLPPFPEAARRVLEISGNPDAGWKDILDLIQYDEGITANCLRVCNSSYHGLRVKVFSLRQAVILLGVKNIVAIVVANCDGLSAFTKQLQTYSLSPGELWRHSVTCAILSQLLVKKVTNREDSALFTAALLHDIGKLVIETYCSGEKNRNLIEIAQKEGLSLTEAEKEIFGVDHAEVGGMVAETWQFPSTLVKSIRNHHRDLSTDLLPNIESWVRLTNLGYYLSISRSLYSYHTGLICTVDEPALSQFGLGQESLDEVLIALPEEISKTQSLLNINK